HLLPRREAEELLRRILHEVVVLDIDLATEAYGTGAGRRVFRVVDGLQFLRLPLQVVLDDDLQRPQDRHPPKRRAVQRLANGKLEHAEVDLAVGAGDPDTGYEIADSLRRHAAAAEPGNRRHARI